MQQSGIFALEPMHLPCRELSKRRHDVGLNVYLNRQFIKEMPEAVSTH